MKTTLQPPLVFDSISALLRAVGQPAPLHPLVALINYDAVKMGTEHAGRNVVIDFYKISFKRSFKGQVKYGQGYYGFEEGGMAFLAPNQVVSVPLDANSYEGYTLYFHRDLLRNYPLGKNIQHYGFFTYSVTEALFLADRERQVVEPVFALIAAELEHDIDSFSQDVLVAQLELLLNYSNRFYHRQFLTRKAVYHQLMEQLDSYLAERILSGKSLSAGLPTVQEVAAHLGVSPRYLSDMLKSLTGQTTQQHLHRQLVEQAKQMLSSSRATVSEIAYQLGFEHSQSFNKLFKRSTSLSPNAYRRGIQSV